jgi:hypothetical protein
MRWSVTLPVDVVDDELDAACAVVIEAVSRVDEDVRA